MSRILLLSLAFCLLFCVNLFSADLYLLGIDSREACELSSQVVEYAHGTIDGKFIVILEQDQTKRLKHPDIKLELLQSECRMENKYLVIKEAGEAGPASISIPSVYASSSGHRVAELEKSSIDVLSREGYMALPLLERKTPIYYYPQLCPAPALEDYPSDTLAEMVNSDSLAANISRMMAFFTRFTPCDSNRIAREWIAGKLASYGYTDITFDRFLATRESMDVYDEPAWNILCRKIGTEKPDEWIMIGAHYDSYSSNYCTNYAPGADCNASGVSAVLELARLFYNYDFKRSLMFIGFGAEEQMMDGSNHLAQELFDDAIDIEILVNLDVISYEEDDVPDFCISCIRQSTYCQVFIDAISRLNNLIPVKMYNYLDDDGMFHDLGYQTLAMWEYTYHPYMHTPNDILSTLDTSYMRKIVQLAATSLPIIDAAADPVQPMVYDVGDGDGLKVTWDPCFGDFTYRVIYGVYKYQLSDTMDVAPPDCFAYIDGLVEGQQYYVTVLGYPPDGYPQIGYISEPGRPLSIPRAPDNVRIEVDSSRIILNYNANRELDFNHYRILRKVAAGSWVELESNYTDTFYVDFTPEPYFTNYYVVLAYDNDLNESDSSSIVSAIPATFDRGILLVDETQTGSYLPSETEQSNFYAAAFGDSLYITHKIDNPDTPLKKSLAGQYLPLFYVDDDNIQHLLAGSLDSLDWYLQYETDFFLAGWRTIFAITGQTSFYPGSFFRDNLGLASIAENVLSDFDGATGVNGWPDLEVRNDTYYHAPLPNIDIFT
ncbi:MAG: M28 family peptidase, partial [Candidatus Zixiibacteriota bacterium]